MKFNNTNKTDEFFEIVPDSFKWLVMYINHETIKRGIFSDLKQVGDIVGVCDATLRSRFKEDNKDKIDINGYSIFKIPYFKSKRGRNGKEVAFYSRNEKEVGFMTIKENIKEKDLF